MATTNKFGKFIKDLRIKKELSLREICKLTGYDPSNWSKIERGKLPPSSNEVVLTKWAKILGIKEKKVIQNFIDEAMVIQGIIPKDVLSNGLVVEQLPAFFRTLRNKKPTKEEIDKLVEFIKKS